VCTKLREVQTADQNFTHPRFHRDRSLQVSMRLGVTPGVVNASLLSSHPVAYPDRA
jgi:hypothetical protein